MLHRCSRKVQRANPAPTSPPHSSRRGRCRRTFRPGRGRCRRCCPVHCRCCCFQALRLLLLRRTPLLWPPARATCARGRHGAASCCRWPATVPRVWRGGSRRSRCWGLRLGPEERGVIEKKHVRDTVKKSGAVSWLGERGRELWDDGRRSGFTGSYSCSPPSVQKQSCCMRAFCLTMTAFVYNSGRQPKCMAVCCGVRESSRRGSQRGQ